MRCAALLLALAASAGPAAAKAPPLSALEAQVQRAEDEIAIRRIIIDYSWALDHRDFETYAGLFGSDGEWINGSLVRKGHDEIMQLLTGLYPNSPANYVNRESLHIIANIEVSVTGDLAVAHSRHLLLKRAPDGHIVPSLAGRYDDELIRENGKWRFKRRVDNPIMPTPEEWGAIMRARRGGK